MAWYRFGTINVTNGDTAVTGNNTRFASNARVGDGLRTPDGEWYEIVNIASETTIGIFPAYQGPTSTDQVFAVAPLQGYVKESADRLRQITDGLDDIDDKVASAQASAREAELARDQSQTAEVGSKYWHDQTETLNNQAQTAASQATQANTDAQTAKTQAQTARDEAVAAAGNAVAGMVDAGAWNAATGTYPSVPASSSFWYVLNSGSATAGGITTSYKPGDILIYSKTLAIWYKIDNSTPTKADLGLGNVDNTSDANKPVSTAQQSALNTKLDVSVFNNNGFGGPIARTLTNNDCNQTTGPGWFNGASGDALNRPPAITFFTLYVVSVGGYINQTAHELFTGRTATRAFNVANGEWSPWQREAFLTDLGTSASRDSVVSLTDTTSGRVMTVGSGGLLGESPRVLNLNTLTKGGSYSFDDRAVGRPPAENYGTVFVEAYSTVNIIQVAKTVGEVNVRMYVRVSNDSGANWANWNSILLSNEYGIGGDARFIAGANLNSLSLKPGRYFMSNPTNGPDGVTFYGFLDLTGLGDTEHQKLTYTGTATLRTFERFKPSSATGWLEWVETTPFGYGQLWTNVTSSRSVGVNYRNTTGRAIQIAGLFGPVSTQNVSVYVNILGPNGASNAITVRGGYSAAAGNYIETPEIVIPQNCYYNITIGNGTAAVIEWREMR